MKFIPPPQLVGYDEWSASLRSCYHQEHAEHEAAREQRLTEIQFHSLLWRKNIFLGSLIELLISKMWHWTTGLCFEVATWRSSLKPVDTDTLMRCTHHHIAPYLAKGADQMSVMIVVHLPQRGSHAGHEAPLEKRNKCIQYTIKFKLKAEDKRRSCPWFWWVLTSWADWISVLKQAWPPGFQKAGALTQWPP